jgi:lincosamide nucleotidyltransferase A/C/D/E
MQSEPELSVVAIDSRRLGPEVVWDGPLEQPRLWPNIAGPLNLDAVVAVEAWHNEGSRFPRLPEAVRTLDCGEDEGLPGLRARDVIELLSALEDAGVDAVVEGGWAVDALLGAETRPHGDLDIAMDSECFGRLSECLHGLGMRVVVDERPTRVVFGDAHGRRVDVHPRDLNGHWYGGVTTIGTVAGREVRCLNANRQIEQHRGYEPGENDYLDLDKLSRLASG